VWSPEFSNDHDIPQNDDCNTAARKLHKKKKNSKMNVLKKSKKDKIIDKAELDNVSID